ncbi:vegetative incompatibility protein HET-E-1 [Tricharina praecox]|uniref:vegetative incompatibility protein HET-E-1 n=1 Tax=Tricharina praecox TaxID=43433 RepID=UPI0022209632|nr:vegetative incompatibility protein HET-E-1 [Tricharina praecox]KAI5856229.1 vegetative incompatibility protein HET-E-1 [Tricharina praecox]
MSPWPQLERLKARWSQKVRSGPRSDEHTSGTGNKQQIRTGNEDHKRSGNQHQNVAGDEHQRPTGNEHENHLDPILERFDSDSISQNASGSPNIGRIANIANTSTADTTRDSVNVTTDASRSYKDSKHNELVHPQFDGPVGIGNTTIYYIPPPGLAANAQTREDLETFAAVYCAHGAAFNSRGSDHEPTCLAETRVDLLADIVSWSDTPDNACIFWLNGMAGTGKSTIARTVARNWAKKQRLGASFFFSKGQGDRAHASKFFTTLAYQLAYSQPSLAFSIHKAICDRPDIPRQTLREQWKHLILEPLSRLGEGVSSQPQSLMLVIDALDECDDEEDTGLILQILSEATLLKSSVRLLVFVTSRPETPIRHGFVKIRKAVYQHFILHEIPNNIVDADISSFLHHELNEIRQCRRYLPEPWPDEQSVGRLVRKAGGLFIYASTVCRFIRDKERSPQKCLALVLDDSNEHGTSSTLRQLDLMYLKIIRYAVQVRGQASSTSEERLSQRFRQIVGSIVVSNEALTVGALSALLNMQPYDVDRTVESLGSILRYPEFDETPIKLLHPSFRDFLLDNRRCNDPRFSIIADNAHRELAMRCLQLMSRHLKQDVCSLKLPGSLIEEIDPRIVQPCLPEEVQYACRYWVDHLQRSETILHDSEPLHDQVHTFLKEHFLHWMEALSLMRNMHDGILMVKAIASMLRLKPSSANYSLQAMAHDAVRFMLHFGSIIEIAPLQLYSSALSFSPGRSLLKDQFRHEIPDWIVEVALPVPQDWGASLQVLGGHSAMIGALAFSFDGKLLASASGDRTVRLWNPATGTCRATLEGHSKGVSAVAFSPDGKLLASASDDKTVRLWDPATRTCRATLEGHSDCVNAVAFSPDGKLLASASADTTVRLWDPATGTCRATLEGHSGWVSAVAFSPDGKLLASASADTTVRLWDPATGTCRATLEGHSRLVSAVAFSPDGKLLASASDDETVRLWDPATRTCRATLEGHSDWVRAVAFSPDGKLLASASADTTVRLWDPATGTCRATLEGHSKWVSAVAFSPDGKLLASASIDTTVRLWDPATGTCRATLEGHSQWVSAVAFSHDGKLLASASYDTTVRLWDPATGTCRATLEGHSQCVSAVAFSHDGKLLASASYDKTVRLWDPATGTCRATLEGHSKGVRAVAFSPDGKLLASASADTTVRLWDPATGTCRATLEGHSDWVNAVAFSPDGKLLASASIDTTVRLWDPATGTCRATLEGHSKGVRAVAFSPDGKLLASASADTTVRLWDPATGTCRATLEGHSDWVNAVAFSPDGKLLASASIDTTVRLWDPATGTCRATLEGHSDFVRAVAFSFDGKGLVLTLADKAAKFYEISAQNSNLEVKPGAVSYPELMLSASKDWIYSGGRRLLYLPHDYFTCWFAVKNNTIALGQSSGTVCFLTFDLELVPFGELSKANLF